MKVALVHDDFMQWGGAERVVEALMELFPDAPVYTLSYDTDVLPKTFPVERLRTSFLQFSTFKKLINVLFFLHPLVFERFRLNGFDVVISSSTRFAKSIITQPQTVHIAYINTPPRFLWPVTDGFGPAEYTEDSIRKSFILLRPFMKLFLHPLLTVLRMHDFAAAQRIDYLVGNSKNVAKRIRKIYRRDAAVIYPFADLQRFLDQPLVSDEQGRYFLIVSRLAAHKRVDIAVRACTNLGLPLKIIGAGPQRPYLESIAGESIEFLGFVPDEVVVEYMKNARAFIYPQEEDFGITAIEAQALGKPVIAYNEGGAQETVEQDKTGVFFAFQTEAALAEAFQRFETMTFDAAYIREHAKRFSRERFLQDIQNVVSKAYSTEH